MKITTNLSLALMLFASSPATLGTQVQLGDRPQQLVADMREGPLRDKLASCSAGPFAPSDFSIGHRGAPLGYPEHTRESYVAAARMGAGIVECDATFTRDKELVCRHSQCDLHSTTNILATDLAGRCSEGFEPAVLDEEGKVLKAASARCCTGDISLDEFLQLKGKKDGFNPAARTVAEYVGGDLELGTVLSHAQSIELFLELGVKMAPELKAAQLPMPFKGMSQADYAQKLVDEYKQAAVPPERVWLQSFDLADLSYWMEHEPEFAKQAVYLDGRDQQTDFDHRDPSTWQPRMAELKQMGVSILAPPLWMLLEAQDGNIVPSVYAREAKTAGLELIAWTLERSGSLREGGGWYYQSLNHMNPPDTGWRPEALPIRREGDVYRVLQVLAEDIGVRAVFSDWPATVTYFANCVDLE